MNPAWTVYLCFSWLVFFLFRSTLRVYIWKKKFCSSTQILILLIFHIYHYLYIKHVLYTVFLSFFAVVSKHALCKVIHLQSGLRLQVVFTSRLVCVSYIRVAITSRLVFVPKLATSTRAAGIVFSLKKMSGWREWEDGVGLIRVGGLLSGYIYIYIWSPPPYDLLLIFKIKCYHEWYSVFCCICTIFLHRLYFSINHCIFKEKNSMF